MILTNKKGWIRILEAFISILLVTTVLLILINKGFIGKQDISSDIYEVELSILREIQLDGELRGKILQADPLPIGWGDFESENLGDVKNKIRSRSPNYLECQAKVCEITDVCDLTEGFVDKDIYAQSVTITANLETYNPRQVKLFCWVK